MTLFEVYQRLFDSYGPQHWWPANSVFEVMTGAILIQRTQWQNAARAVAALEREQLLSAEAIATSQSQQLERLIRCSGFFRQKRVRLQDIARWYLAQGGETGIRRMDTPTLRDSLLALSGVGPETADVICLYAFDREGFVVDAYARRLFARLGMVVGDEPYAVLKRHFESALPRDSQVHNEYHALIVAHCKHYCRKQPLCSGCCLRDDCNLGRDSEPGQEIGC